MCCLNCAVLCFYDHVELVCDGDTVVELDTLTYFNRLKQNIELVLLLMSLVFLQREILPFPHFSIKSYMFSDGKNSFCTVVYFWIAQKLFFLEVIFKLILQVEKVPSMCYLLL